MADDRPLRPLPGEAPEGKVSASAPARIPMPARSSAKTLPESQSALASAKDDLKPVNSMVHRRLEAPVVSRTIAGKYQVIGRLGEGGMGVVYRAIHSLSKMRVALKVVHPHLCQGPQGIERFRREVSASAEIDHPGLVKVYDAGVDDEGSYYIAMELLEGESLLDRSKRAPYSPDEALVWIKGILGPLAKAHERGFVHRDLKPDNVYLAQIDGREEVRLLDFGLVRDISRAGGTQSGITFGTPEYMAPEQALNAKNAIPASDVWSLGVMAYELFTGEKPFRGETPNEIMVNAIKERHVPLVDRNQDLPQPLVALIERCLEKDPKRRPTTAKEFLAELDRALSVSRLGVSTLQRRGDSTSDEATNGFKRLEPLHRSGASSSPLEDSPEDVQTGLVSAIVPIDGAPGLSIEDSGDSITMRHPKFEEKPTTKLVRPSDPERAPISAPGIVVKGPLQTSVRGSDPTELAQLPRLSRAERELAVADTLQLRSAKPPTSNLRWVLAGVAIFTLALTISLSYWFFSRDLSGAPPLVPIAEPSLPTAAQPPTAEQPPPTTQPPTAEQPPPIPAQPPTAEQPSVQTAPTSADAPANPPERPVVDDSAPSKIARSRTSDRTPPAVVRALRDREYRTALTLLEGHMDSEPNLRLAISLAERLGQSRRARELKRSYVSRYPRGREAATYRRQLR